MPQLNRRPFLKGNENHISVLKLKRNEPLTRLDLAELEKVFLSAGAQPSEIEEVRSDVGLGLFVRSLVGLERDAAKRAFDDFLIGKTPTADQQEFLNMIIDHLTERGAMDPNYSTRAPLRISIRLGSLDCSANQKLTR